MLANQEAARELASDERASDFAALDALEKLEHEIASEEAIREMISDEILDLNNDLASDELARERASDAIDAGNQQHETLSDEIASDELASNETLSDEIASDMASEIASDELARETASNERASDELASNEILSDELARERASDELARELVSDELASNEILSDELARERASDELASNERASDELAREIASDELARELASDELASNEIASDELARERASDELASNEILSDEHASDEILSDEQASDIELAREIASDNSALIPRVLVFRLASTPFISFYDSSLAKMADPAALPGSGLGLAISPNHRYVAAASSSAITIYDLNSGAPVKTTGPSDTFTNLNKLAWSPDGSRLAVMDQGAAPFISIYDTTTWTKVTGPSVSGGGASLAYSPDGAVLGASFDAGTVFREFNTSDMSLRTAASNLPTGINDIAYSPDGLYVALSGVGFAVYKRATMSKLADPDVPPSGTGQLNSLAWTHNSAILAVGTNSTPFIWAYNLSSDTLSHITGPASAANQTRGLAVRQDNVKLYCAYLFTSPFEAIYTISGMSKDADLASPPASATLNVATSL
jgi:hypothetical protein